MNPVNKTSHTSDCSGRKEKDFKAAILQAWEIREEMKCEHHNRIGVAYDERETDRRADYLRPQLKISFVDTHFHMDRLQSKTGPDRLDTIMICGPMPHIPSQLEAAIAVFCDGGSNLEQITDLEKRSSCQICL